MQTPVMVMNTNSRRETGRKAQLANIQAAKVIKLKRMHYSIFSLFFSSIIVGSIINCHLNLGTSSYVKNALRSNGRYRYDKRWVINKLIYSNAILR